MDGQPKIATEVVMVETYQLLTLLRIVTEARDPFWLTEPWVRKLAGQCGLDLTFAEKSNRIMERAQ